LKRRFAAFQRYTSPYGLWMIQRPLDALAALGDAAAQAGLVAPDAARRLLEPGGTRVGPRFEGAGVVGQDRHGVAADQLEDRAQRRRQRVARQPFAGRRVEQLAEMRLDGAIDAGTTPSRATEPFMWSAKWCALSGSPPGSRHAPCARSPGSSSGSASPAGRNSSA